MLHFLSLGLLLGLSAGLAPGPLLALVVAETLRNDLRAGVKVALSPLVTDLPIILFTLLLLARLADIRGVLGGISLAGGVFLLYVGGRDLCRQAVVFELPSAGSGALARGIMTNALSPYPYLFWLTVGAPAMFRAAQTDPAAAAAFIGGFYLCLLGSKVLLALLVGRFKALFGSRGYLVALRLLAVAVCAFAVSLLLEGLRLLGWG